MQELFQSNFALKVFALILATLLWFAIESNLHHKQRLQAGPFTEEVMLDLPHAVAILVSSANTNAYTVSPTEVQLKVAGEPEALAKLDPKEVAVFVQIPETLTTEALLELDVKLPSTVRLINVQPDEVTVQPVTAN